MSQYITKSSRIVRTAAASDIPAMLLMYAHSKSIMRANGNMRQWSGTYPDEQLLRDDIARGISYVIEEHGVATDGNAASKGEAARLIGTFAFIVGKDPSYSVIEGGCWEDVDVPYGTIHRLACVEGVKGIAQTCFDYCDRHAPTLRVDTHADNSIMNHIAQKEGFTYRGIIHVSDGTPRNAYQRLMPQNVCQELTDYVEAHIMPQYDAFDEAHRQPHIRSDIRRGLEMAERHSVNKNMIYCAAAYHDIGCCESREKHHIVSGRIIREDRELLRWFSPSQIEVIAQAAEDHRASSRSKPRSIYGLILAEADRDLNPRLVVTRTVQFGMRHSPEPDKEGSYQRTLLHLKEKYGPEGYLQLYLPDSPNRRDLEALHALIANPAALRSLFEEIWKEVQEGRSS